MFNCLSFRLATGKRANEVAQAQLNLVRILRGALSW
jgi:hypothetical protein